MQIDYRFRRNRPSHRYVQAYRSLVQSYRAIGHTDFAYLMPTATEYVLKGCEEWFRFSRGPRRIWRERYPEQVKDQ